MCGSIDAISCIKRVAMTKKHKSKDWYIAHGKKAHSSVVEKYEKKNYKKKTQRENERLIGRLSDKPLMLQVVVKGWIFVTCVVVEEGELCGRKNQNEILSCYALLHN